jgi:hypothetical protein
VVLLSEKKKERVVGGLNSQEMVADCHGEAGGTMEVVVNW